MALGYPISYLVFEPIADDKLCMLSTPALTVWNKSLMFNCNGFPLDAVGLLHERYKNTYNNTCPCVFNVSLTLSVMNSNILAIE